MYQKKNGINLFEFDYKYMRDVIRIKTIILLFRHSNYSTMDFFVWLVMISVLCRYNIYGKDTLFFHQSIEIQLYI